MDESREMEKRRRAELDKLEKANGWLKFPSCTYGTTASKEQQMREEMRQIELNKAELEARIAEEKRCWKCKTECKKMGGDNGESWTSESVKE